MFRTFLARLSLVILGCTSLLSCLPILPAEAQETRTAVIIGDSQAQGLNHPLAAALEAYHIHVTGASVHPGWRVSRIIEEADIASFISSRNPQLVIMIAGGNDQVSGSTEGRTAYESTLRRAVTALGGSHIVWVGPATSQDDGVMTRHIGTAAVQSSYLPGLGVRWIDGRPGSAAGPFQGDSNPSRRSHLTGAGYRRWACELAPQIAETTAVGSCGATAEADQTFPDAVADVDQPGAPATTGGGFTTYCDPNAAPVPITLGVSIGGVTQVAGLPEYVNTAYRYLVSVILVISIIMVVWGGFLYLTGAAGVGSVQRGKQIIRDSLIGMVIVLAAYAILNTINPNTTQFSLSPKNVACEAIDVATHNPNADEGGNIRNCTIDANCGPGRVCLRTATAEGSGGVSAGQCTQGLANELCRCSGGCDIRDVDGQPTNGNGVGRVDCQSGTCRDNGVGMWVCGGAEGGSCNMHSSPPAPCGEGQICVQPNQDLPGLCFHGDYRDQAASPPPICSSMRYPTADAYYRATYENSSSAYTGGCLRVAGSGVDDWCMAHRYQCSTAASNPNRCTEEYYAGNFETTGAEYSFDFTHAPANLQPWNYVKTGCRKNIGASCLSDDECPSLCINGTCSGFCYIFLRAGAHPGAGGATARADLDSSCTTGCGAAQWSPVDFAMHAPDAAVVGASTLDVISPVTIAKAACYPKRDNGQHCDYNDQCTSGNCSGVSSGAFPSFSAPLDPNAGNGTCTP